MRRLRHDAASCNGPRGFVGAAVETRVSASRPRLPSRVARHPGVGGSTRPPARATACAAPDTPSLDSERYLSDIILIADDGDVPRDRRAAVINTGTLYN
jgi:hypothetical protein